MEDVITVTAESPLLDERRISTGATVSQTELQKIPTARDPWAVLQTTPGVLTDRVNVGGNETGQQAVIGGRRPGHHGHDGPGLVSGLLRLRRLRGDADHDHRGGGEGPLRGDPARAGWTGITLERALAAAPSLKAALRKAADAGLLRGFLALVLQGKGCSEPPADVLAEAQAYLDRFGAIKEKQGLRR